MNENNKDYTLRLEAMLPVIEEKLKSGGSVTFGPHGISMLPLIRQGKDSVTISALKEKPQKGDVIFYRRADGQFVLHRVVGQDSRGYIMCGDNQFFLEHGIKDNCIIGIMTEVIRDGKTISCNNKEYLRYVRRLPWRRMRLRTIQTLKKIKKKILH